MSQSITCTETISNLVEWRQSINPQRGHQSQLTQQDYDFLRLMVLRTNNSETEYTSKQLLTALNELASNSPKFEPDVLLSGISKLIRPSPPVTEELIPDIEKLKRIDILWLNQNSDNFTSVYQHMGYLLYGFARFGGILRSDLLQNLCVILQQPIKRLDNLYWIELEGQANETHIYHPPAIVLLALSKWYSQFDTLSSSWNDEYVTFEERRWLRNINSFIKQTKAEPIYSAQSNLIKGIKALLSFYISPCSISISSGELLNLTLEPSCYNRLITGKAPKAQIKATKEPLSNTIIPLPEAITNVGHIPERHSQRDNQRNHNIETLANNIMKKSRHILNRHRNVPKHKSLANIRQASHKLKTLSDSPDIPINFKIILQWASFRLVSKGLWSNKLSISTVAGNLSVIKRYLLPMLVSSNVNELNKNQFDQIYDAIIDISDSHNGKKKTAAILRDFHSYLEAHYSVPPSYAFNKYIFAGTKKAAASVDAHVLMPWEYKKTLRFLAPIAADTSNKKILKLARQVALIFGFKFGLRRNEIMYLLKTDLVIHNSVLLELNVSDNEKRSLKTVAGNRRIRAICLDNEEQEIVLTLLSLQETVSKDNNYLFASFDTRYLYIPVKNIFNPISKCLEYLTNDQTMRFHRLRHSYATWRYLYENRKCKLHPIFRLSSLSRKQISSLFDNVKPTNDGRFSHDIGREIGHSSPSITMTHYIHSAIWLHEIELDNATSHHTDQNIAAVAGVSTRTIVRKKLQYEKLDENTKEKFANSFHDWLARMQLSSSKSTQTDKKLFEHRKLSKLRVERGELLNRPQQEFVAFRAIREHYKTKTSLEFYARQYNVPLSALEKAKEAAKVLFTIKYGEDGQPGHSKHRHRLKHKAPSPDSSKLSQKALRLERLRFEPRKKEHRKIARRLLSAINTTIQNEPVAKLEYDWLLKHILNNDNFNSPTIKFTQPSDFHRFCKLIIITDKYYGIDKVADTLEEFKKRLTLRLSVRLHKKNAAIDDKQQLNKWYSNFQLDELIWSFDERIINQNRDPKSRNIDSYIRVAVSDLEPIRKGSPSKKRQHYRRSSTGFSYALSVLFLTWELNINDRQEIEGESDK
ncbi:hypothetical protein [Glaciecola sp. 33A]|uniref:hypothetical protein n=1 Tax=Glaciecola sp. 33A TaxID=2057807 RepID=UPI000C339B3A|nr:hypothetical protein [Glaciecola sp. 33A]PKI02496.1 hypothetical protein CXF81_06040 [Glaciecola sp. 33A]